MIAGIAGMTPAMNFRPEVLPFICAAVIAGAVVTVLCRVARRTRRRAAPAGLLVTLILSAYFLYFFRDPPRTTPQDPLAVVAAADGVVAKITELREDEYLKTETVRISIFLSLFDVHVNRAPISGRSKFLGYYPGKRYFTFQEKSSQYNQHNKILIEGENARCLVNQIVGPVCRRVVYWLDHDRVVHVEKGERIGMMKFGSRLDMYLPKSSVTVVVKPGDKVTAGETVVATVRGRN